MTRAKRVLAAVALAAGASALAAPAASAAVPLGDEVFPLSVSDQLDSLATSGVPAEQRADLPAVSGQLNEAGGQVKQLHRLSQLNQLTGQAAPVVGLLGAVQ